MWSSTTITSSASVCHCLANMPSAAEPQPTRMRSSRSPATTGARPDCTTISEPPSTRSADEYGFEAGGAAILDRLWLWGSYDVRDIDRVETGGGDVEARYEGTWLKMNAQLGARNSAVACRDSMSLKQE